MSKGLYSLHDPNQAALVGYERFSCAYGAQGWRYVSQLLAADGMTVIGGVDLTVDAAFRPLRLEMHGGGWRIRGGAAGGELMWVRSGPGGAEAVEASARAGGFTGRSPAFVIVTARRLGLEPTASTRIRLVELTEPSLGVRVIDESWRLAGTATYDTDSGALLVERYEVSDLAVGEPRIVHLAGDIVLAAPGIELEELDGPPNRVPNRS